MLAVTETDQGAFAALGPGRALGVDGEEVADLEDTFGLLGDLARGLLDVLRGCRATQLGNPVVDLDVDSRQVRGARVLTDAGPYSLLDLLLLLGHIADMPL